MGAEVDNVLSGELFLGVVALQTHLYRKIIICTKWDLFSSNGYIICFITIK